MSASCEDALGCIPPLMAGQHWFREWLGAVRQLAIAWNNIDPWSMSPYGVNRPQWIMTRAYVAALFWHNAGVFIKSFFRQGCNISPKLTYIFTWQVLRFMSVAATPMSVGWSTMMATHGTVIGSPWPSPQFPSKTRVDAAMTSWK